MKWRHALVAAACALACGRASADPVTIFVTAVTVLERTGVINNALSSFFTGGLFGGLSAARQRRKARKAQAEAKARYNASLQDRAVTVLTSEPRFRTVYGVCVTGGDVLAILTSDKTGRNPNGSSFNRPDALKHIVIHLASHEVENIEEIYIDGVAVGALDSNGEPVAGDFVTANKPQDRTVTFTGSTTLSEPAVAIVNAYETNTVNRLYTPATVTLSSGNTVITGPSGVQVTVNYRTADTVASVRIGKHLGTTSQTVDTYLNAQVPTKWTTAHRLRGLAYIVVTLDLEDARFQGGLPNITARVRGKKIFDPRNNTTAWSGNPALCIRDFLLGENGYGVSADDIDDAYTETAANVCDQTVSFPLGAGTTNSARYRCGGVVIDGEPKEAVLEELAESMAGEVSYGGQWMIMAGAWTPPVELEGGGGLTDDHLSGQIEIVQAGAPLDELFNSVRGQYIPSTQVASYDYEPYQNSTFVAADGEELWVDMPFPFTQSAPRCRNIARIRMEQARNGLVITYPAKLVAWPLRPGDRIAVTSAEYGFTEKLFRVTDWQFGVTSPVLLTLQEDGAAAYDEVDATEADPTTNTDLPSPDIVPALTSITVASGDAHAVTMRDGTYLPRVRVGWAAITAPYVVDGGWIYAIWRRPGSDIYITDRVPGSARFIYLNGAAETEPLVIRLYAENSLGRRGPETIVSHTVTGTTISPGNVEGFSATVKVDTVTFKWDELDDSTYKETDLRRGASYTSFSERIIVSGTTAVWKAPAAGTYTWRARHRNKGGQVSASDASVTVTTSQPADEGPQRDVSMTAETIVLDPENATAGVRYNRDGTISVRNTVSPSGYTLSGRRWNGDVGSTVGDDYRIRLILISGDTPDTGPLNTYQTLNANRAFELDWTIPSASAFAAGSYAVTIEALSNPGVPVSTGVLNLRAIVEPDTL